MNFPKCPRCNRQEFCKCRSSACHSVIKRLVIACIASTFACLPVYYNDTFGMQLAICIHLICFSVSLIAIRLSDLIISN